MTMARHLLQHPELAHGPIRIGFTPDEEIGRGVHRDLPNDLKAACCVHARRRRTWRDRLRDLLGRQGVGARAGRLDPPGPGQGQTGQRAAPGGQDRRHAAARHADARDDRRPPGVHPHLPDERYRRRGRSPLHPARLRAGWACATTASLLQQVCATMQATEPRARITCTITEQYRNMRYWLENDMRPVELAREACRRRGIEHFSQPDPRRHRWLAPDRAGRADAESLHRDAEHPRTAGMGQRAGHGRATEMCIELAQLWSRESGGARPASRADACQGDGARGESSGLDWLEASGREPIPPEGGDAARDRSVWVYRNRRP